MRKNKTENWILYFESIWISHLIKSNSGLRTWFIVEAPNAPIHINCSYYHRRMLCKIFVSETEYFTFWHKFNNECYRKLNNPLITIYIVYPFSSSHCYSTSTLSEALLLSTNYRLRSSTHLVTLLEKVSKRKWEQNKRRSIMRGEFYIVSRYYKSRGCVLGGREGGLRWRKKKKKRKKEIKMTSFWRMQICGKTGLKLVWRPSVIGILYVFTSLTSKGSHLVLFWESIAKCWSIHKFYFSEFRNKKMVCSLISFCW